MKLIIAAVHTFYADIGGENLPLKVARNMFFFWFTDTINFCDLWNSVHENCVMSFVKEL